MFARRHPLLFTLLVFTGILAFTVMGVSLTLAWLFHGYDWEDDLASDDPKVGVVEILGPIAESRDVLQQLKTYRENDSVKAVVLRIDSPGGAVGPSQEIFREIRKTAESKKVIASLGSVAASGGYYIAAGTDGIVANPGTITGSIGVIMAYTNIEELFRKIGLAPVVIKSGEFKDMGSPVRPMRPDEEQLLTELAENIHNQFVEDVARGRNLDPEKVRAVADGRILTGKQAETLGLVDRMGNFADALEWAGRLGGIKGDIEAVYPPKKKFDIWDQLTESASQVLSTLLIQSPPQAQFR